jgi:hypothetical protein
MKTSVDTKHHSILRYLFAPADPNDRFGDMGMSRRCRWLIAIVYRLTVGKYSR